MDNFFDLLGIEAPVEVKKEAKKADKKETKAAKKETKKKVAKKIKLPVDIVIPYAKKLDGFSIEGKEEVTEAELLTELKARYPYLICSHLFEKDGLWLCTYNSYGEISKGELECSKFLFGGMEISFEAESNKVDCRILKEAFYAACPAYTGCELAFFAENGVVVPTFMPNSFSNEIKQDKISVIVPGITSFEIDGVDGKITPNTVKEKVSKYSYLEPCVFKKPDKTSCIIMVSKSVAGAAKAAPKGFDISSGNVKISLVFNKLDLKPESFNGETEVTADMICDYLVKSGYPEFDKKRCSIEKVSDDLLIAIIKSSTKGC